MEAEDCLIAGMSEHDYGEEPEDAAGDEMSYWPPDDEEIDE